MKGFYLSFLLIVLSAASSFGQSIFLRTQGQNTNVCGENMTFTIEVRNLSTTQTLTGVVVNSQLPTGITFISESSTPPSYVAGSPVANPSFSIGSMAPGTTRNLVFLARTDCNLVNYLNDNGIVSGIVNNKTTATFTIGGTTATFNEPNGSESYNIFYPVLTLRVDEADKQKSATRLELVERRIHITNTGNGRLLRSNLFIEVTREPNLAFVSVTGHPLTVTQASNTTTIRLSSLSAIGNGDDYLDPNETFTLVETARVSSCADLNLTTNYFVKWGCNSAICNLGSNNSQDASLIQVYQGTPSVVGSILRENIKFCTDQSLLTFTFTNTRGKENVVADRANRAAGFTFDFYEITSLNIRVSGFEALNKNGEWVTITPSSTFPGTNTTYRFDAAAFATVSGGMAGLSDIDGNGTADDLLPQDALKIRARPVLSCPAQFNDPTFAYSSYLYYGYGQYQNSCGSSFTTFLSDTYQNILNSSSFSGPTDLTHGQTGLYSFALDRSYFPGSLTCSTNSFNSVVTFPSRAYNVTQVRWIPSSGAASNLTFTQDPDGTLRVSGGGLRGRYDVTVVLDCALGTASTASSQLEWSAYYNCSGSCCTQVIGRKSYEIFNHCFSGGGPGDGSCLRTTSFTVERATFGYAEPSKAHYYQLPSTKLTRNSPGVRLNAAIENDNILATAKGHVAAGNFDNAHVELHYASPIADNILEFASGYFIVNTGAGAQTYPVTTPPVVSNTGQTFFWDFKVDGTTAFPTGTTVDLYATFKVRKLATLPSGENIIPRFRAFHYGIASAAKMGCESFGATFTILKYFWQATTQFSSRTLTCGSQVTSQLYFTSVGSASGDYFPNEWRPNTRIGDLKVTVPKGMSFVPGTASFFLSGYSTDFLAAPASQLKPDGTVELTWTSSQLPVFDVRSSSNYLYFNFNMSPDCFKDIPASPISTINTNYTNYEFIEGTPDQIAFSQNNSFVNYVSLLSMQANVTQDAFAQTVSWPVTLCEDYRFGQSHNWLAFDPGQNINLLTATKDGVSLEIVSYDPSAPHKKMIKVGQVGSSSCKTIILTASYSNCRENVTDEINLSAGRSCGEYPINPTDLSSCKVLSTPVTGKLFIRYKNADLSQTVVKGNPKSNLCESIPFEVNLLSSGIGNMRDVYTIVSIPNGMIYKPGTAYYQYPAGGVNSWTQLSNPVATTVADVSGTGWNLSSLILGSGEFANQTNIRLRFELEASCNGSFENNYDPGVPVIITSLGTTNCGDPVVRAFQSKVEINGFDLIGNILIPNVEVDEICKDGFAPKVRITVTNPETIPSNAQDLVVTLPVGLSYLGKVKDTRTPHAVSVSGGLTTITWKLPAGIAAGQTMTGFEFVMGVGDDAAASLSVETRTYIFGTGTCTATGGLCALRATTGLSQIKVNVKTENCYICQEPEINAESVCANIDAKLEAWNGANLQITCSSETAFKIVNNGTADMEQPVSAILYYVNASNIVQSIVVEPVQLYAGGDLDIPFVSEGLTLSRMEVEQTSMNPAHSGIIVQIASNASVSLCSRASFRFVPPVPASWSINGSVLQGANVTHNFATHGIHQVTFRYCADKTQTFSYEALDCRILDLSLYDECSSDPQVHRWYVYNPNSTAVNVQYQLLNSPHKGTLEAAPETNTYFVTAVMPGNRTVRVQWQNELSVVREASGTNDAGKCYEETCDDCYSSFTLLEGKEYILSGWISEDNVTALSFENAMIGLEFGGDQSSQSTTYKASGPIVDGWQRVWVRFTVPDDVNVLTIRLLNQGSVDTYFDDIRIHPFNSNMKSFVYDPSNQRLMAELDENNYATFYEYDEEGALIRVKKETERGVKTIQESRNNTVKKVNGQ
jgi:uncharacterized repeat protein (TIGR01451 family)